MGASEHELQLEDAEPDGDNGVDDSKSSKEYMSGESEYS